MQILPTILTDSVGILSEQLSCVAESEAIEVVQIDIIDGQLVDNLTVTPSDVVDGDTFGLQLDFHLMTDEPLDYVHELTEHKHYLPVRNVIGQVEHMSDQSIFVQEVKKHGWQAGLSLDYHTPIDSIDREVWAELDCVQLMSVEMGFQGAVFQDGVFDKLVLLNQELQLRELTLPIFLDGGVSLDLISPLKAARVAGVGVGSGIWRSDDPVKTMRELARQAD
ncbi:MAG: hypothetical protein H6774_00420 [Pseudomonadales bacterium]|nr:hypothetical protein [Pseudomonadales bacterium]